jgi:S1-C subfamily serine protease
MKKLIGVILASALLAGCLIERNNRFVYTAEKVTPAVVEIHVYGMVVDPAALFVSDLFDIPINEDDYLIPMRVLGSGIYVTSSGDILTCAHLFTGFKKILSVSVVDSNGDIVAGEKVALSDRHDLGLVKTTFFKTTPFVKLADPRGMKVGQEVVAIGSPYGLPLTVTTGIISALYRDFEHSYNMTQSDAAINPGNSGGPLFNLNGDLVGINTFMLTPTEGAPTFTGIGFSVQAGQLIEFLALNKVKYTLNVHKDLNYYIQKVKKLYDSTIHFGR